MRRLDPWAALLLGGILAMGVVILLATPGPWRRVVGTEPPVRLEAPVPDDVAVFVMGGRGSSCSGVVWLHVDTERSALTAVVVAPSLSGFSPTDGFAPIAAIADSAGPRAAAEALSGALGVSMDAWVALDRKATELAVQAMVPLSEVKAARTRYREARAAWRGRGGAMRSWVTQYETLSAALPSAPFQELGVVAFSNYVLGFGFVSSDLTLQGVTSLGEALRDVDRGKVEVRAASVVVERCRDGEVWRADASRVEPLRQSLVIGIRPPETDRLVTVRRRAARVLVVAPFARRAATRYAAAVRRSLERSAGPPVEVTLVAGADVRLAFRTARELDRRPALAVLVAPVARGGVPAARKVYALLRARRQEAVASGPLPTELAADAGEGDTPEGAAVAGRLPVSWLPEAGRAGTAAGGASPAALSPSPDAAPATLGVAGGTAEAVVLAVAARDNAQTLVRACWPGTLSPDLASTRLRFAFVAARHTGVGVVSAADDAAQGTLARLRLWGYPAVRLALEDGGWRPPEPGPLLCYRPGLRTAALALAGDLGLPARSVVKIDDTPRELVLVAAE
jgi:hypothetical protein